MVLSTSQYRTIQLHHAGKDSASIQIAHKPPSVKLAFHGKRPSLPLFSQHQLSVMPPTKRQRTENDQQQQSTSTRKSLRKSVSFAGLEHNRCHVFDITPEEKRNTWYNRMEYHGIRKDMQATALCVRLGITDMVRPDDLCLRGLEASISPQEGMIRRLKRQLLIKSIIQEQQRGKGNGAAGGTVVDPEAIRELSTVLSSDAQFEAVKRGVQDAQF